jgi:DivIVA domain-containing protein
MVNGDEVRNVRFGSWDGYDASQVDDLLRRLAVELDAGRPAGPLIENATFRTSWKAGRGYDIDAVDWFLDQLARREDHSESAGMSADPWRGLAVVNYLTRSGPGGLADRTAAPSRRARRKQARQDWKYLTRECAGAWRDFGQQPGTHLRWVRAGPARRDLRTAEQQTMAWRIHLRSASASYRYGRPPTISTGGRTFTLKWGTGSSWPDIAELVRCSRPPARLRRRKRQAKASSQEPSRADGLRLGKLLDETGTPVLYASGEHYFHHAGGSITFPDQRWLRFPVRGTGTHAGNAIMTAVDQAGNKVARYRFTRRPFFAGATMEITVHPGQPLTDELVLAIAISAPWVHRYFNTGGGV